MITLLTVTISLTIGLVLIQYANGFIGPSQYDESGINLTKETEEFMKKLITNDSQRVESITEQEYNNKMSELNKLLESRGQEPITLAYKESCYYHEDDKYVYETMQCIE